MRLRVLTANSQGNQAHYMADPNTATLSGGNARESGGPNEMHFFRYLKWVEVVFVFFLAVFVIGVGLYLCVWVIWGSKECVHSRLVTTLRQIDKGWKIALMAIPVLFFRPIFKFLINLRKGPFDTESGLPASAGGDQEYPRN